MKVNYNPNMMLICLLLVMLGACKKNDGPTPVSIVGNIKTQNIVTTDSTGTVVNTNNLLYTYDLQGRLSLIQNTSSGGLNETFTYHGNIVTMVQQPIGQAASDPVIYNLNNQGYAQSDNQNTIYTYDVTGRCLTAIVTLPQLTDTTLNTYLNENLIVSRHSARFTDSVNLHVDSTLYTYLPNADKRNALPAFWGQGNVNLAATQTVTSGTYRQTANYTYDLDTQSRVVTERHVSQSPSTGLTLYTTVTQYTYY